jgi:UDP-N-acetylglucosamine 2-epimerase (non-hydrolysing)
VSEPKAASGRLIVFVIGTRAQLIKMAPVMVACRARALDCRLLLTGQHRDTMDDLLREFGVDVEVDQALPQEERSTVLALARWLPQAAMAIRRKLRAYAQKRQLDVMVHGDTLSTVLGARAGRAAGARVLHVESGLTSGSLLDPFPEEISRRIVFRSIDVAICPTAEAAAFMKRSYSCDVVESGGNTVIDAVRLTGAGNAPLAVGPYLVVSLHRFQNLFSMGRLEALVELVSSLAASYDIHLVLHPATRKRLAAKNLLQGNAVPARLQLRARMGYSEFIRLASGASCILTDGGSNQEELAVLGVPTIIMRDRTERPDGLGMNAIMEANVPGGVLNFLLEGRQSGLRQPLTLDGRIRPSDCIAAYLAGATRPG